jgi:hypothetical protein
LSEGKPNPPPHLFKQQVIKYFANLFSLDVFIETGTYLGNMIEAVKQVFTEIYTIEISQDLYKVAKKRFSHNNHIKVLHGNSGKLLDQILSPISKPCLFWLDAHYSSGITAKSDIDTPVNKELYSISRHPLKKFHVILIDDARCYTGANDYPELGLLKEWSLIEGFENFDVRNDIIRIYNSRVNQ